LGFCYYNKWARNSKSWQSLDGEQSVQVIENGEVISKKLSEFKDGDKIKTISWDFKNKKEVII